MTDTRLLSNQVLPEATALLDSIEEPAILLSRDYEILAANHAYRQHFGDGKPLHQRNCYEVSHHYGVPCDQAGEVCPLKQCLDSGEPRRVLHLHHTPNGDEHVDVSLFPIRNADGVITCLLEKMHRTRTASSRPAAAGLVGRSPAFNRMLALMERAAPSDTGVLLLGESGTGKELVARAIHQSSRRASGPFVAVECSGLSEALFESELFGHEKGAFTGAHQRKTGLVQAAHGGTLFLDEVGDIPLSQQVKLLRLLETGTFRRVGGTEVQEADFRLVLATHRDLRRLVDDGGFRQDLYYRVSAFPIPLPPLRERGDDIRLLAESLLQRLAPDRPVSLSAEALGCLRHYRFPGNVRELRNILERALLLADGDTLSVEHLPEDCSCTATAATADETDDIITLEENEQRYLAALLKRFSGDRTELADRLGISQRTLFRKISGLERLPGS
jgi:DNA-binding NtrC family response regulator